jgi:hypothetical protein
VSEIPGNRLVLFLNKQCDACQQVIELSRDVADVDFEYNWVVPSRVAGMYLMADSTKESYPKLIKKSDLPTVPALYDPTLDEMIVGLEAIEAYFRLSGLLPTD